MRFAYMLGVAVVMGVMALPAAAQDTPQVYRKGDAIVLPRLEQETKPKYTPEAIRARVQGLVEMSVVVERDGRVGAVDVTKSLDTTYGLDEEAVKAVRQWKFKPGTKDGKPVRVRVDIEMTFTLRDKRG